MLFFIAGCSTHFSPASLTNTKYQQTLEQLEHWKIKGRISIKTKKNSFMAHINWQQNKEQFNIRIYGSLGQTYAKIYSDGSHLVVLEIKKKRYTGNNAQSLMQRVLGWKLPVKQFSKWMKGQKTTDLSPNNYSVNDNQSLATLSYEQWQIQYQRYKTYNKILLPQKIYITHPDIQIKLSIHQWLFDSL